MYQIQIIWKKFNRVFSIGDITTLVKRAVSVKVIPNFYTHILLRVARRDKYLSREPNPHTYIYVQ